MANRKISDLTALTAPAAGDLLPIVDISEALAADKNKRITLGTLLSGAPLGSAAAPTFAFSGDPDTGIYSPGADQLAISTNGTEKLIVKSDGKVGIGTSLPATALDVVGQINSTTGFASTRFGINTNPLNTTSTAQSFARFTSTGGDFYIGIESSTTGGFFTGSTAYAACLYNSAATPLQFFTGGAVRATLNSTGLGIGTTSPTAPLEISATNAGLRVTSSNTGTSYINLGDTDSANIGGFEYYHTTNNLAFIVNQNEAFRVDSSRRLLVGTSSAFDATADAVIQAAATNGAFVCLGNSDTSVLANENLGLLRFFSRGGSVWEEGARIEAEADLDHASGDKPTRLVFSTTADGAASPTERMRITQNGNTWIGNTGDLTSNANRLSIEGSRCIDAKGTGGATSPLATFWNNATTGDNVFLSLRTETSDTIRGSITYNRAGGVVAYNITSDYRAKTLLGAVENPGETIDALKVYRGVMNGATVERPMLVAHEAKEVAPYCVTGQKDVEDDDGNPIYQQMDHQVLVPLLIAEIQQLRIRVAALEAA